MLFIRSAGRRPSFTSRLRSLALYCGLAIWTTTTAIQLFITTSYCTNLIQIFVILRSSLLSFFLA